MANGPGAEASTAADAKTGQGGAAAPAAGAAQEDRRGGAPAAAASGPAPASEEVGDRIRVSCLTNSHYHAAREAYLDGVHRWFMFLVVVLGAGALIDIFAKEHPWTREAFAAGAAVLAALDLTFDLSNRARIHTMMKRRYFELLAEFREGKKPAVEVEACLDRFSADEEPVFHTLHKMSWNAAQESVYGDDAYRYVIPWYRRLFANVFRQGGATLRVAGGPEEAPAGGATYVHTVVRTEPAE